MQAIITTERLQKNKRINPRFRNRITELSDILSFGDRMHV
jgi:hypothetical protein